MSSRINITKFQASRRINKPALSVPVGRADFEKSVTAHTHTHTLTNLYPLHTNSIQTPLSSCSFFSTSISQTTQGNTSPVPLVSLASTEAPSSPLVIPRKTINIVAFNVRTSTQIVHQASLAITLSSLNVDICCVSETRIQDSSAVLQLSCPNSDNKYFLRLSGDDAAAAAGRAGVGFALSSRAHKALIDWIPVNSRLFAARFSSPVKAGRNRSQKRALFVVSLYIPTNCSDDSAKDEFYNDLNRLLNMKNPSDIVIVVGDYNAQLGKLTTHELDLGGRFALGSQRADNGDRLLHFCSTHGLFLANTNFKHKKIHCATLRSPNPEHPWLQFDHIAISRTWRRCIKDCRSYWSTALDSGHALGLARFSLRFSGSKARTKPTLATHKLSDPEMQSKYRSKLHEKLSLSRSPDLDVQWGYIRNAPYSSAEQTCGFAVRELDPWISTYSVNLICKRHNIAPGTRYAQERRKLGREIKNSLRQDRENWWHRKAEEMESAANSGNSA